MTAGLPRRAREFGVEVDEDGAGQMTRLVRGPAVRAAQLPADVEEYG